MCSRAVAKMVLEYYGRSGLSTACPGPRTSVTCLLGFVVTIPPPIRTSFLQGRRSGGSRETLGNIQFQCQIHEFRTAAYCMADKTTFRRVMGQRLIGSVNPSENAPKILRVRLAWQQEANGLIRCRKGHPTG